jgi:hypothetical protein
MRTAILCLLLLATASVVFAAESQGAPSLHFPLRELLGLVSFGALGGMLFWHFRR